MSFLFVAYKKSNLSESKKISKVIFNGFAKKQLYDLILVKFSFFFLSIIVAKFYNIWKIDYPQQQKNKNCNK